MDLQLEDKVALVAAATSEVGFTLARALAVEGARVVLTGRAEVGLHETVDDIGREGGRAFGMATDLNRLEGLDRLLDRMARVTGYPDIVVLERSQTGVKVNPHADGFGSEGLTVAAVRLVRAVLPAMRERGWGRLLHVTSTPRTLPAGQLTLSHDPYMAMADVAGTLLADLGDENVTMNALVLGYRPSWAREAVGGTVGRRQRSVLPSFSCPSGPPVLPIFVVLNVPYRSVHACQS